APKVESSPPSAAQNASPPAALAAPPAVDIPSFTFEGGKSVDTTSDPVELYKNAIQAALLSGWDRPMEIRDLKIASEVEVRIDKSGRIVDPAWKHESGNKRWDDSVHKAVGSVKPLSRPPPANFPSRVTVRFDLEAERDTISSN